jgi:Flp pilus assembly protein TadG
MSAMHLQHRIRRAFPSENGSAMAELVIAIPILLLLAMGVADYARIYYAGITVANAAEAGVHYGVARTGTSVVDSMIMAARLDAGSMTLDSVAAGQTCRCPGTGVVSCGLGTCGTYGVPQIYDSVWVQKNVALVIRYLGLPSSVTVTRSAVLREK